MGLARAGQGEQDAGGLHGEARKLGRPTPAFLSARSPLLGPMGSRLLPYKGRAYCSAHAPAPFRPSQVLFTEELQQRADRLAESFWERPKNANSVIHRP